MCCAPKEIPHRAVTHSESVQGGKCCSFSFHLSALILESIRQHFSSQDNYRRCSISGGSVSCSWCYIGSNWEPSANWMTRCITATHTSVSLTIALSILCQSQWREKCFVWLNRRAPTGLVKFGPVVKDIDTSAGRHITCLAEVIIITRSGWSSSEKKSKVSACMPHFLILHWSFVWRVLSG